MSECVLLDICTNENSGLCICAVWLESSLGTFWITKDAKCLCADNEDLSDCAAVQFDLSLYWAPYSKGNFSHVASHLAFKKYNILTLS